MFARAAVALIATVGAAVAAPGAPTGADRQVLRRFCTNDYVAFCSDHDIDSPKVQACFRKNRSRLSKPCRNAIAGYLKNERSPR